MLNRENVLESFRKAMEELSRDGAGDSVKPVTIADRAWGFYRSGLADVEKVPSLWTFRSYVCGKRADAFILSMLAEKGVRRTVQIDPNLLLLSFRQAMDSLSDRIHAGVVRPRTVAFAAHIIYCGQIQDESRKPSALTFKQFVSGKSARPEIVELLKEGQVHTRKPAKLDRAKVMDAFCRAIERLEGRIARGRARPLHVADRAYDFYLLGLEAEACKPSRCTFRHLVYGKTASPEISELLKKKLQ